MFEEDLSISYLRAVAAKAEVVFDLKHRDVNSKDANLSKSIIIDGERFEADLNVQLKSTYSKSLYSDDGKTITYSLKAKNYNDLCRKTTTPIILCLLILPEDKEQWVMQTLDELTMKHCMYWLSLQGMSETTNTGTCSIKIPKENVMNAKSLNDLLSQIAKNGGVL